MNQKVVKLVSSILVLISILVGGGIQASADSAPPATALAIPIPPAPPDGFNPLLASAADLQKYNFPSKPTNPNELKSWEFAMSHAIHYVAPVMTLGNQPMSGQIGTIYGPSWAGYEVHASDNQIGGVTPSYNKASGHWVIPQYFDNGIQAFWVGFGGGTGAPNPFIIQAGTGSNCTASGATAAYEFWVEDYYTVNGTFNPPYWVATPVVHPNDEVYVSIQYGLDPRVHPIAFLENVTTAEYTFADIPPHYYGIPPFGIWDDVHWDGSTGEAIYEVPHNIDGSHNYGGFGQMTFTYCDLGWQNNNSSSLDFLNYFEDIMTNNGQANGMIEGLPLAMQPYGTFSVIQPPVVIITIGTIMPPVVIITIGTS